VTELKQPRPKSFLRWAGSKKQLLPVLKEFWRHDHVRYIEPFAGSACLFFELKPESSILGDINGELIQAYEQIKSNIADVLLLLYQASKNKDEYYRLRALQPELLSPPERTARFIYLNRYCFNGLYRTNLGGKFNVPYGGEKSGHLPSPELLMGCHRTLQNTTLVTGDFEKALDLAQTGDFVYMDPPYSVASYRVFNEYTPAPFNREDITRLRAWMDRLTELGIEFLVSYADCQESKDLRKDYEYQIVFTRRHIAGFVSKRKEIGEVMISNRKRVKGVN
jgi:DNA adenine methylase